MVLYNGKRTGGGSTSVPNRNSNTVLGQTPLFAADAGNGVEPYLNILRITTSHRINQALFVAAQLGIADLLATGAKSVAVLARKTKTHAPSLYRLLRALASVGIFVETRSRTFALTETAALLQDRPESMRSVLMMANAPFHLRAWGQLLYSVQTGRPGCDKANGDPLFTYLAKNQADAAIFNAAMTSGVSSKVKAVLDAYDFSRVTQLTDVGGGAGALMAAILQRYPKISGTVYDLPYVIPTTIKTLDTVGVASRCEVVAGDFFERIPRSETIILSRIIHDWDDRRSIQILKNCHRALREGGKVLLAESIIPPANQPSLAKFLDLEMLVVAGGMERTEAEYKGLLERAGFELGCIATATTGTSVIEGLRIGRKPRRKSKRLSLNGRGASLL